MAWIPKRNAVQHRNGTAATQSFLSGNVCTKALIAALLSVPVLGIAAVEANAATSAELEAQRSAILECKNDRGVRGAAYIEQSSPGSRMDVRIAPYDQVTPVDADAINNCAAGRVGAATTTAATYSTGYSSSGRTIVRSIRAPGGYPNSNCGRSPSILYRGDLYCQWANR